MKGGLDMFLFSTISNPDILSWQLEAETILRNYGALAKESMLALIT